MGQTSPKTMTFMIDKNTTVDGKLKVGANADVTYREEGGNNIAVSVRVSE
jgi:Cu/Ag efflux protein CusF